MLINITGIENVVMDEKIWHLPWLRWLWWRPRGRLWFGQLIITSLVFREQNLTVRRSLYDDSALPDRWFYSRYFVSAFTTKPEKLISGSSASFDTFSCSSGNFLSGMLKLNVTIKRKKLLVFIRLLRLLGLIDLRRTESHSDQWLIRNPELTRLF